LALGLCELKYYFDNEQPPPRHHPWRGSEVSSAFEYYDFKKSPEPIGQVLEDFRPWERYEAVPTYYDLLRWLNGQDSALETNESGLLPPQVNTQAEFPWQLKIHGRMTVFARSLAFNTDPNNIQWMASVIAGNLENAPNFPGRVAIGNMVTFFTEIQRQGHVVTMRYWAWGNTEEETFGNVNRLFLVLSDCLRGLSSSLEHLNETPNTDD